MSLIINEKRRTAFWLTKQGLSYAEIGKVMRITRARAKQLVDEFNKAVDKPVDREDLTKV